jgi:hypothetical protein
MHTMDLRGIHDSFIGRHRREPWYAGCDLRVGGPTAPEGEIVVYVDPEAPGVSTVPASWEGLPVRSAHKDVMGLVYDGGPHPPRGPAPAMTLASAGADLRAARARIDAALEAISGAQEYGRLS